jgi:hypothetical protein
MKAWREKFQAMAMAVAFAEEGERDVALSLVKEKRSMLENREADLKKRLDQRPRRQAYRA